MSSLLYNGEARTRFTAKNQTSRELTRLRSGLTSVQKAAASLGVTFGALSAVTFVKDMTAANQELERIEKRLAFAGENFTYVKNVAEGLGLSLVETATGFSSFAAAAKGTALEGQDARDVFEAVAQASAVMGLSSDQTTGALRALEQMISKGNVQAEELRGQLSERLPGAFNLAARAMGVSTQELNHLLETGQVLAADLLPKLAVELKKTYQGSAPELTRAINGVDTSFFNLKTTLGTAGGTSGVISTLDVVSETVDNVAWSINTLGSALDSVDGDLIDILGGIGKNLPGFRELALFNSTIKALKKSQQEQYGQRYPMPPRPTDLPAVNVTTPGAELFSGFGSDYSAGWEGQARQELELQRAQEFNAQKYQLEIEQGQMMRDLWMIRADEKYEIISRGLDAELQAEEAARQQKEQIWSSSLSTFTNLTNALYVMGNKGSRRMFELNKIAGIAEATISTYRGAAKALELGWPMGPIAAAAITAQGLAQVASIQSQTFSGGSSSYSTAAGGASPVVTTPDASGADTGQEQQLTVILKGAVTDAYIEEDLIPMINEAGKRNVKIVYES